MLDATISRIAPLDEAAMQRCKVRLDNLTKPLNSLGAFEQLACQMAGVTGLSRPKMPQSSIVLAADGTIEPGALPRIFAAHVGAELVSFDAGQGRGRSRTGMVAAMEAGILAARIEAAKGSKILGLGTLGESASGDAARIFCSEEFIQEPVAALVAAGSPEIAGLCGVILGAAAEHAIVVLDDMPTLAAALAAVSLAPLARGYLVGSHFSAEQGSAVALRLLKLKVPLTLGMNLGEGTGAALTGGAVRKQRGGAWNTPPAFLLNGYRYNQLSARHHWDGARCARQP